MDGGGITRKKGYLWLAAVLLVALLIVVFIGLRPSPMPSENTVSVAAEDSLDELSRL